jgi:hypothetical protein
MPVSVDLYKIFFLFNLAEIVVSNISPLVNIFATENGCNFSRFFHWHDSVFIPWIIVIWGIIAMETIEWLVVLMVLPSTWFWLIVGWLRIARMHHLKMKKKE